ncbi:MAG TPA: UvrD-helicase domain-containing protein [Nocardioidaceae bacterium]|nr:UvrD-helicase domain-containing protein [Nocardioidaceae bacterium]
MSAPAPFNVCGPLPSGTTVLEASAGTGKTFTIAALATRYVAEGHAALGELMLVTFGRAATQELRERVRDRLVTAERGLASPARAATSDDDLLRLLADADAAEVELRRKRLASALADFDAATIATTHAFCQQMLVGLGLSGDFEPHAVFVEDIDDIVTEVVDDLYLRKWGGPDSEPALFTYAQALSLARKVITDRHAALEPREAEPDSTAAVRVRFAARVRVEVDRRKRQRRLRDYEDLLTRLRDALQHPVRGEAARARVRSRYSVVLIDEFQDTDPVQWEILHSTFHGHQTLVLIGDPKQAIYAFRGGDVVTYLQARQEARAEATLATNWRSDEALVEGLGHVFREAALGDPRIVVRPVESAHSGRRLLGDTVGAAVRLRVVTRSALGSRPAATPRVGGVRAAVAADATAELIRLLESGAQLHLDDDLRRVAPGDVAVLVHTNTQAVLVHDALRAAGVPAVLTGAVDVFSTAMARDWLVLLQALEQPHRQARAHTAALGCFVGWDAAKLAEAGEAATEVLVPLLGEWAAVLDRRGVPALLEVVTEGGLLQRLLGTPDGERQLTDLRHIGEALHRAAAAEQLGTSALVEWLQRRIRDAGPEVEERSRRLESDAAAVQVITVHRSKGLQFPVVFAPFGWDRWIRQPDHPRFHADGGVRSLDVGGNEGALFAEHCGAYAREDAGESLRLLYVGLTRAQCQVVAWWAPSSNTSCAPLHRMLFADYAPGAEPADSVDLQPDGQVLERLAELAARSATTVSVEEVALPPPPTRWTPPTPSSQDLRVASFDRSLDTAWRRTSYTGLTADAHEAGVGSEPEEPRVADEPESAETPDENASARSDQRLAVPSPMAGLPSGASFGIVVHSVLENVDVSVPDLRTELVERSRDALARRLTGGYSADELAAALLPALETPLGKLAGGVRLRDVASRDRLAEMTFELPLAGGDHPGESAATLTRVAELLRRRLPADDPFAAYPDRLSGPGLEHRQLRGYLAGSLDAVLRLGEHRPRFLVVDYKTNWLGGATGEPLTAWHYRPEALAQAMLAAHYPLQLLLYLVALHRYLRWRQPAYDPDRDLGGGLYLFLRGMCGPSTPTVDGVPCGVFGWVPPPGLVDELSTLLAGGAG